MYIVVDVLAVHDLRNCVEPPLLVLRANGGVGISVYSIDLILGALDLKSRSPMKVNFLGSKVKFLGI